MSKLKDALNEYSKFEEAARYFGGVHTPVNNYIVELEKEIICLEKLVHELKRMVKNEKMCNNDFKDSKSQIPW